MNNGKKVLVLEENVRSRAKLCALAKEIDAGVILFEADCTKEAANIAVKNHIDLFLLNIVENVSAQSDLGGLHFAENLRKHITYRNTPIIFITSLEDPKYYAYSKLHCYQYVEKPYDENELKEILAEVLKEPKERMTQKTVCFRSDGILVPVKKDEILYLVCEKPMIKVVCEKRTIEIGYRPLKTIKEEIADERFFFCNRSVLINGEKIRFVDPVNNMIQLYGTRDLLPIGETYKEFLIGSMGLPIYG